MLENYYFTFGSGQLHQNKYVKIAAKNYEDARIEMIRRFDTKWAFQYDEKSFKGQPEEYGITELK